MAKKNKKWKDMLLTERDASMNKLGKELGVDASNFKDMNHSRADRGLRFNQDKYNEAVQNRLGNDYSTRRAMEARGMAGDKKAQKMAQKGIGSLKDAYKARQMMEDWHKEDGNGGEFSSASDYAGVAYSGVEQDRDAQTAAYDDKYAKTTDLNALKDKLMAQATEDAPAVIEPSDRIAGVEERLEGAASNSPPSLFDKDNADPAKANDQKDAARNFLNDYKLDVAKGANIKSDIETGVSNAARHVRDTYGR